MRHKCLVFHHRPLPPAAQSLAALWEERRDGGGAVARPAPLLHRGLWLQRARCVYPTACPPHHIQQAVDVQIHCHWRSAWVTQTWAIKATIIKYFHDNISNIKCHDQLVLLHCLLKLSCYLFSVITDPFDLNHNLGAGLSRKSMIISFFLFFSQLVLFFLNFQVFAKLLLSSHMTFFPFKIVTNFIMKAFINGRTVFGTPVKVLPPVYPSHMVSICFPNTIYFFNWMFYYLTLTS